jgi:hypothetical protein
MNNKGITKIEIIIVIGLVALVVAADIVVISYLNSKKQDIQVLAEVSQIRSSLDLFLARNSYYPGPAKPTGLNDVYASTQKLCIEGFKKFSDSCAVNILNPIPNDYLNSGNIYVYSLTDNGQNYKLEFNLKTNFSQSGLKQGKNCANNSQILSQACF